MKGFDLNFSEDGKTAVTAEPVSNDPICMHLKPCKYLSNDRYCDNKKKKIDNVDACDVGNWWKKTYGAVNQIFCMPYNQYQRKSNLSMIGKKQ